MTKNREEKEKTYIVSWKGIPTTGAHTHTSPTDFLIKYRTKIKNPGGFPETHKEDLLSFRRTASIAPARGDPAGGGNNA